MGYGPESGSSSESSNQGDRDGKDQSSGTSQSGQGSDHGGTNIDSDHGDVYDSGKSGKDD
jgi:hypothetical protein